ncbi:hypothetical protein [Ochrovirga pacifica]|uniref:hypothetical protein n=1 Tax=Ochrovirga pacifica TaxID=1042376 RepID=UPI000255A244|nr:hypothetical protein [Ochrovirga pacifica]
MKKRIFQISIIGFLLLTSCSKEKVRVIENEDFKWTVTIPKNFRELSDSEWDKVENKGMDAFENVYGEEVENRATTLFAYKSGQFQTFESNFQIHDLEEDGNYYESNREVNKMTFETLKETMPNAILDSVSSKEMIDGLEFDRFQMNIDFQNGIEMTTVGYSRLFNDKDFTINIVYTKENVGKELIENILTSKFE